MATCDNCEARIRARYRQGADYCHHCFQTGAADADSPTRTIKHAPMYGSYLDN